MTCLRKLWANAGCSTPIPDSYTGPWQTATYNAIVADMGTYGGERAVVWRIQWCRGSDMSSWPADACKVPNCDTCSQLSGAKCATCKTGYRQTNGNCVPSERPPRHLLALR